MYNDNKTEENKEEIKKRKKKIKKAIALVTATIAIAIVVKVVSDKNKTSTEVDLAIKDNKSLVNDLKTNKTKLRALFNKKDITDDDKHTSEELINEIYEIRKKIIQNNYIIKKSKNKNSESIMNRNLDRAAVDHFRSLQKNYGRSKVATESSFYDNNYTYYLEEQVKMITLMDTICEKYSDDKLDAINLALLIENIRDKYVN